MTSIGDSTKFKVLKTEQVTPIRKCSSENNVENGNKVNLQTGLHFITI